MAPGTNFFIADQLIEQKDSQAIGKQYLANRLNDY